ncbi:hypothetical protein [Shimazuella kribbensis]|uniref:hypothetical protein n=1 Tax=Shimazuella kribbensis TaxID=139808 RepID=UPI0012EB4FA8|nr:hypothetical protein [Shimazuella kribbensis]
MSRGSKIFLGTVAILATIFMVVSKFAPSLFEVEFTVFEMPVSVNPVAILQSGIEILNDVAGKLLIPAFFLGVVWLVMNDLSNNHARKDRDDWKNR